MPLNTFAKEFFCSNGSIVIAHPQIKKGNTAWRLVSDGHPAALSRTVAPPPTPCPHGLTWLPPRSRLPRQRLRQRLVARRPRLGPSALPFAPPPPCSSLPVSSGRDQPLLGLRSSRTPPPPHHRLRVPRKVPRLPPFSAPCSLPGFPSPPPVRRNAAATGKEEKLACWFRVCCLSRLWW
ncbi:hypothetical protein PVAP13_2NG186900 [Panicum virgatum]|uniref:Uncharacterized protein n=1 Tax=Panicum virgatum TaxID=38727 RepID=A0A8T0V9M0_PANVG|nr:hypothetical protein PVAP13_2NG186900 [Panicum virgatum]